MIESSFQQLINNAALLLVTAFLVDIAKIKRPTQIMGVQRLIIGSILSIIGIMLMLNPWTFATGIIFDTRSILLSISGLFFGLVPTLIAMISTALFRLYQGGAATVTGVSVIFATGTIGLAWRYLRKKPVDQISWIELYLFGVVNHVVMLLLMLILPLETALRVLSAISVPVLLIYPAATTLLGFLLVNREQREKTRRALQEREEQLSLAVQAANIGFFNLDFITGDTQISAEWKRQLGYEDDEIRNDYLEWEMRLHPDDREAALHKMKADIAGSPNLYEANFRLRHKDGTYRWILSKGMILRDAAGKAVQFIGCHVDITRQKEQEQAIRTNERRFRSLAESSQDIIVLFNRDLEYGYINPAGLKTQDLKESERIDPITQDTTAAGQIFAGLNDEIGKIFRTGETSQQLVHLQQKEKKLVFDTRLSPVLNAEGQAEGVLGISRDITAILETGAALRESEEKFRQIFEAAGMAIFVTNLDGTYIRVNPAALKLLGYEQEEICRLAIADITHPDELEMNLALHQGYRAGERDTYSIEKRYIRKNGGTVWVKLISTLVKDDNGSPVFSFGMAEDITERKWIEEKEKQAQQELQRLLANADQSRLALLSVIEDHKIAEDELNCLTKDLLMAYDSTLEGWSNALELRERETAGHSRRVVSMTLKVARAFNVEGDDLAHVERGALLHDIGKMGIPDSILLKPGPLTDDEWVIMRKHTVYAYNLLVNIDFLKPALDIPYSHHERWDGSGYPQGLAGTDIPLAARIFSVVDVWDALFFDRPYRPAWSESEIVSYIKGLAGKHFDPRVVDVFLDILVKEDYGRGIA